MDKKVTAAQHQLIFITPNMRPHKRCFSVASVSIGTDCLHYYLQCLWFFTGRRSSSQHPFLWVHPCRTGSVFDTYKNAMHRYSYTRLWKQWYTTTHCPTEPVKTTTTFSSRLSGLESPWQQSSPRPIHQTAWSLLLRPLFISRPPPRGSTPLNNC